MSVEKKARILMAGHHHAIENRQKAMLGRIAAEMGIEINPTEYRTGIQGKTYTRFRDICDRSHVAMS